MNKKYRDRYKYNFVQYGKDFTLDTNPAKSFVAHFK